MIRVLFHEKKNTEGKIFETKKLAHGCLKKLLHQKTPHKGKNRITHMKVSYTFFRKTALKSTIFDENL